MTRMAALNTSKGNSQSYKDTLISIFIGIFALAWLFPIVWTLWTSLHPYKDVLVHGIVGKPSEINMDNYVEALHKMQVLRYFLNTLIIIAPTIFFTLLLSSWAAFVLTKFHIRFHLTLLLFFTAGSMFPAQVIYYPIFKAYIMIGDVFGDRTILYNNYLGVILVHIAMQVGFATFVLHSHMQRIPREFTEQAQVDGASIWRQFWTVIIPLLRAPLATLALLLTTILYNDFIVGWSLLKSDSLFPITTSLTRVGAFNRVIPDQGVLAAGAFMVALPLIILFLALKRHFASSVMFGTSK